VGLALVVVALRVVRREGTFFVQANQLFVKRFNLLFADQKLGEPAANPNSNVFALPFVVLRGASSIRDNFQFVFLVFGLVNVVLLVGVSMGAV
jgi:hypothetical protein